MNKFITILLFLSSLLLASCEKEDLRSQEPVLETIGQFQVHQVMSDPSNAQLIVSASFTQPNSTSTDMISAGQVTYNGANIDEIVHQGNTMYHYHTNNTAPLSGPIVWTVEGKADIPELVRTTNKEMPYFEYQLDQTTFSATDQFGMSFSNKRGVDHITLSIGTETVSMDPIHHQNASGLAEFSFPASQIAAVCPLNTPIKVQIQAYNQEELLVNGKKVQCVLSTTRVAYITLTQ